MLPDSTQNDDWSSNHSPLCPKCSICSAPSSGYHFNAASCSACAAFFRRTVSLNRDYKCDFGRNCRVHYAMRSICRCCRYNKCIDKGMIRTGVQPKRNILDRKRRSSIPLRRVSTTLSFTEDKEGIKQYAHAPVTALLLRSPPTVSEETIPTPTPALTVQEADVTHFCPESLLEDILRADIMLNERRKLLHSSLCSVSLLMSSTATSDVPFLQEELKENTVAGMLSDARPHLLMLVEWLKCWPCYEQLLPYDRKVILRRCVLFHSILDCCYMTFKCGLPNRFIIFNGTYVGISEETEEGWKDEPGVVDGKIKKDLYRPLLKQALKELVYPMRDIDLSYSEFLILKSLAIFKSTSGVLNDESKNIMLDVVEQLLKTLHYFYKAEGFNQDEAALRTGNLILLLSNIYTFGMQVYEIHQKIKFFELFQIDDFLGAVIACNFKSSIG